MKTNPFKFLVIVCALLTAVLLGSPAWAQKGKGGGKGGGGGGLDFQIVALDNGGGLFVDSSPRQINSLGEIVGQAGDTGGYVAVYWTTGTTGGTTTSQIHVLPGGSATAYVANDINDLSEIVGTGIYAAGNAVGLYWATPDSTPVALPPTPGDDHSWAWAINNQGVIVGISRLQVYDQNGDPGTVDQVVAWRVEFDQGTPIVSGPVVLPTAAGDEGFASDIVDNDAAGVAMVVGRVEPADESSQTAVTWTVVSNPDGTLTAGGPATILDVSASAYGANNSGDVCGRISGEPVVWIDGAANILNRSKFFFSTSAHDINASGVITGMGWYQKGFDGPDIRAAVWPSAGGSIINLSKSLGPNSPFVHLRTANAINDSNEIVGSGWDGSDFRAFLAIPD